MNPTDNRTSKEVIGKAISTIRTLSLNVDRNLPMFADAEITLRFETEAEIEAIAKALKLNVAKPRKELNFTWCCYKYNMVKIYIQTHEAETKKEKYNINGN